MLTFREKIYIFLIQNRCLSLIKVEFWKEKRTQKKEPRDLWGIMYKKYLHTKKVRTPYF